MPVAQHFRARFGVLCTFSVYGRFSRTCSTLLYEKRSRSLRDFHRTGSISHFYSQFVFCLLPLGLLLLLREGWTSLVLLEALADVLPN